MQSIHRALKLHHHRHTGKLLAHRHTSYRVLFILLLLPMFMLVLVGQLDASASDDLAVNAVVPAPIPSGAPVITSPANNTTTQLGQITASGTCPVMTPAVIIALYDNSTLVGSSNCQTDGTFSVVISLTAGTNTLVATVMTITGGTGASSQPVTVTYQPPVTSPSPSPQPPIGGSTGSSDSGSTSAPPLFGGISTQPFISIAANGDAQWQGSFVDGTSPYKVSINWGDGTIDTHVVGDHLQQTFFHKYAVVKDYVVTVDAIDATGRTISMQVAGVTYIQQQSLIGLMTADYQENTQSPILAFMQRYIWQIYIVAIFSVLFLWYIEHGRHLLGFLKPRHKH